MPEAQRHAFVSADSTLGEAGFRPYLPLTLDLAGVTVDVAGLLDTGAAVNVLPYPIGIALGAVWERQKISLQLSGNLAQHEARVLLVTAVVDSFAPVRLAFAWTAAEHVPLILGQVNFFMEFNVCFYRSELAFDIRPKA